MDRKKQFATVALSKTRQRRPSTVKLFGNGQANPFADANSGALRPTDLPAQRDDSGLEKRKPAATVEMSGPEMTSFDGQQTRHSSGGREAELMAMYRAREPQLVRQWSAQQPFQFGAAADVAVASQGFVGRRDEERMRPEEWEQREAGYNDWELGMLHKLAKVAELLLTPDAAQSDGKRLEVRLDEIARQDTSERAKAVVRRSSAVSKDGAMDQITDSIDGPPPELTPTMGKKKSPRSPETGRKNFGSWSAKVAQAKKKSLERKKGADTLTQLRAEDGSALEPDHPLLTASADGHSAATSSKSLFGIWNKDGTMASPSAAGMTLSATPSSPLVGRKSGVAGEEKVSSEGGGGSGSGGSGSSKSGSSKRSNSNAANTIQQDLAQSSGQAATVAGGNAASTTASSAGSSTSSTTSSSKVSTPVQTRKTNRFSTIRAKRSSVKIEEEEGESVAFPGLSLRSADAASFLELLKSDKERKQEDTPSSPKNNTSPDGPSSASTSPESSRRTSPTNAVTATPPPSAASSFSSLPLSSPNAVSPNAVSPNASSPPAPTGTPTLTKRAPPEKAPAARGTTDLGLKLSFLTQSRRSTATKSGKFESPPPATTSTSAAGTANTSPGSSTGHIPTLPVAALPTDGAPPQKSPKSKRFSMVFSRRADSPSLSPRNAANAASATDASPPSSSPRSAAAAKGKGKSPRNKGDRLSTPVFGRRKTGSSPRSIGAGGDDLSQSGHEAGLSSPPLSARDLVADASALEALDDMLGAKEEY